MAPHGTHRGHRRHELGVDGDWGAAGEALAQEARSLEAAVLKAGLSRVGLLATKYTMEQAFYRDRLAAHGVETVVPDEAGRAAVQRIIYDELCVGRVEPSSREELLDIARSLDTEGIVLGCTELELSVGQEHLDVPVFPTTTLHCEAALDLALSPGRG